MPPAYLNPALPPDRRAADLVSRMTLDEKISQMVHDAAPVERLGVPAYNWWNEALHGVGRAGVATVFPQAIGLAATFDLALMARIAEAIADEARAKHHDFVRRGLRVMYGGLTYWSPNVNIFRDPRWGRGQETYGEDPFLTSRMGVTFVRGLQGDDPDHPKLIATPKHFAVHSGPEPERHRFNAVVSERDLRETYLPAFEACIVEGGAGSIMPAYNRTNGEACAASPTLLGKILRGEWGFGGYVVSDCWAIGDIWRHHGLARTVEEACALAVRAGTDLNCGEAFLHLGAAVEQGLITEAEIDRAVTRLMTARFRLGMFDDDSSRGLQSAQAKAHATTVVNSPAHIALAREAAVKSIVLLKNDGLLPLRLDALRSVALLGPAIADEQVLHGNYNGTPGHPVTFVDGLAAALSAGALGEGVALRTGAGCAYAEGWPNLRPVPASALASGATASDAGAGLRAAGLRAAYWDNGMFDGPPALERQDAALDFVWRGTSPLADVDTRFSARWTGTLTPDVSGLHRLAFRGAGRYAVYLDGDAVIQMEEQHHPVTRWHDVELDAGRPYSLRVDFQAARHARHAQLLWATPGQAQIEREQALTAAADADAVILCLGLTPELEGEEMKVDATGFNRGDRVAIDLPAPQQALLELICGLGKPVVLVLVGGSAISVPWAAERVPAILHAWYPGEQGGHALADILLGAANPSGRLPVTVYRSADDLPPFEDYALAAAPLGRTYRYFRGQPLFPFGHGLSYTRFAYTRLRAEGARVMVDITNVGEVAGDEVAQLYVRAPHRGVPRDGGPLQELKGFARVTLQPGETREVAFDLPPLRTWDDGWRDVTGEVELAVGASSGDIRLTLVTQVS